MSYIAFFSTTFQWVGRQISIVQSAAPGTPSAYQFNNTANSMLAPTIAAWPMSPLVVP